MRAPSHPLLPVLTGTLLVGAGPSGVIHPPQQLPLTFSHRQHLDLELACTACHPGAETSVRAADRLRPEGATCQECHSGRGEGPTLACPDCHPGFSAERREVSQLTRWEPRGGARESDGGVHDAVAPPSAEPAPPPPPFDPAHPPCDSARVPPPVPPRMGGRGRLRWDTPEGRAAGARPAPVVLPPARLRFPHRRHHAAGVGCLSCHAGVREADLATVAHLPREGDCLACHEARGAATRCATCHPSGVDGRLRTSFSDDLPPPDVRPEARAGPPRRPGRLVPTGVRGARHDDTWAGDHGPVASATPDLCEACHGQRHCGGCHAGSMRPLRAHPDDWVTLHPLHARGGTARCQSCHRLQTSCRDCHRRTRVVSASEDPGFRFPPSSRFHPRGWVGAGGATAEQHGYQARRSLGTCVSCHSERTCVRCHAAAAAGGLGVSPHPPGFDAACRRLLAKNPRPCRTCHGERFVCAP